MKRHNKTLVRLFLSAFLLVGLPSVSMAYSVVEEPPQNVTIIDSGEVGCYVSISNTSARFGDVFYNYQAGIFCKNTFSNTSIRINRIEISSGASNPTVRVVVKGFPIGTDNFNLSETKTYSISALIPPNSPNNKSVEYYFMGGLAQATKIFIDISGQEKVMLFDTPLSTLKYELMPNETFKLYVVDETTPIVKVLSPAETCVQEHGLNSTPVGGSCTCRDNFMFDNAQQCRPAGDVCVNEYGKGGIPSTAKDCSCANGYHLDGRHCIADAKPIRYISASVKKWADDNYPFDTPCSSNKNFSADDIKVCSDYNTALYRVKYDWQISTPTVFIPTPPIAPATPPVVGSVSLPITQPKNTGIIVKPKTVQPIKPVEVKSTTTATTTNAQVASTTIEVIPPVVEEVKLVTPQPPSPPPAPKTFWSKVLSWFKFWN